MKCAHAALGGGRLCAGPSSGRGSLTTSPLSAPTPPAPGRRRIRGRRCRCDAVGRSDRVGGLDGIIEYDRDIVSRHDTDLLCTSRVLRRLTYVDEAQGIVA